MIEEIEKFVLKNYDYITVEVDKGRYEIEFMFFVSVRLTDFEKNDIVKSIHFNFYWNKNSSIENNLEKLKSKINNSIIKFFMKEG